MRREGRLTEGQRDALERLWPQYGVEVPAAPLAPEAWFGRQAPTLLEIGFGTGDHLLSRALAAPDWNCIGAEVHRPGVGRLLLNADNAGVRNLRVAVHDAVEVLRDWLLDASLAEVLVYFPDPWHKTRHNKRRLIQPAFVELLARKLTPGGTLRLATDWAPYAEHMLQAVAAVPALVNQSADGRFVERPATRPKTRFEARGERLGHAVFDLEYRRS